SPTPPPSFRQHRLLAAPGSGLHLALVLDPCCDCARPALHPPAPARGVAPVADACRVALRTRRPGGFRVHGLPARDREAREPHDPAARGTGPRGGPQDGLVQSLRFLAVSSGIELSQTWYAPGRWGPRAAVLFSTPRPEVSSQECSSPASSRAS